MATTCGQVVAMDGIDAMNHCPTLEDMFLKPKTDGHLEAGIKILPDGILD
ncbi:unnamed protein product [Eruca vesicaria subsp. sativa]|uniref:Uncharacterized protein n=1 Tax=Eruca vesicaria subsp. sativa TaxID=29727 RepID=A0ABC8IUZ0_ERUVS|nr:unnamed protein product [Eruca vesicaria subsp. sativa]